MAESEDKCRKIPQKKKNQLSSTLSSTVCLLPTLFEDLGCAIELHEKIANEVTALHSLDLRNYLFNGQEEGDYLFGQGIINEASSDDKEFYSCMNCGVCLPTESSILNSDSRQ